MEKTKGKASQEKRQGDSERHQLGLERLIFFSDAVFAIAITLLILDIRLPAGAESADNRQLFTMLIGLSNRYFAYFISFWVIGLYWISHHRKFLYIKRFDYRLLTLNLLLLMVIAFIPFPTTVMSENGNRTATIFYSLVMALGGLFLALLWWHAAHHHHLIDTLPGNQLERREMVAPLVTAIVFLISIGIAFWNSGLVRLFWLVILPVSLFAGRRNYKV
jgi:uncharacterized membrane protein